MLLPLSQDDTLHMDAGMANASPHPSGSAPLSGADAALHHSARGGKSSPSSAPLFGTTRSQGNGHGHGHGFGSVRAGKKARRGGGGGALSGSQVFRTCSAFPEYFARVLDYRQMDLDATFYQMVTLCVQPSKVYKSAYYRKQTKNRWARDDPAFAVIQLLFLLVATLAWAVAFHVDQLASYVSLLFHAVVVEWLGFGVVIATTYWWIANHHLRMRGSQGMGDTFFVEQRVEWQYAFDIHCNAFFVLFLFLYVLQFLLLPLLASSSFVVLLLANVLYTMGWGMYVYITFLGYMALPFLHRTERLLSPMVAVLALFISSIFLKAVFGATFNFTHMSTHYYYST